LKVIVNGKTTELAQSMNLQEFVSVRKLSSETVIIELNEKVVKKSLWTKTLLSEGDHLELVSLVGGG
jgi:sulfur carrier protein